MAFSDWETVAADNSTTLGVNIAENCPAANMNNAVREVMAQIRAAIHPTLDSFLASTSLSSARSALGVSGGSTSANNFSSLTNSANKVPYMTGSNGWSTTDFTSFGRSLVGAGDAATALALLGGSTGISSPASSLTSPGYVKLDIGGTNFTVQWGTASVAANTSTTINYPTSFTSFSIPVISARGDIDVDAQHNPPGVTSAGTSSFTVFSAVNSTVTGFWIAVGK